jgi:hypothetical protein
MFLTHCIIAFFLPISFQMLSDINNIHFNAPLKFDEVDDGDGDLK